jgi:hypothetical protein
MSPWRAAQAARYTDKRRSTFRSGASSRCGASSPDQGVFGRLAWNRSGSFEQRSHLQVDVGLVGHGPSTGGAPELRRSWPISAVGAHRSRELAGGAPLGVARTADALSDHSVCAGSFDRPYNIRLHLTALREPCLLSVRAKPPVRVTHRFSGFHRHQVHFGQRFIWERARPLKRFAAA